MPLDLLTHSAKIDLYLSLDSYAEKLQEQLADAYEKVAANTKLAIEPHRIRHDRTVRACDFKVDDYVWVLDTAKVKGVTKKLSNRYKGPYRITLVVDDANYKIKTLNGKKQLMVNKARLKRCFPRRFLLDLDIDDSSTAIDTENVSPSNKSNHITGKTVSGKNINKKVSFKDGAETIKPKKTAKKKHKSLSKETQETIKKSTQETVTSNMPETADNTVTDDGKRIRKKPEFFQAGSKK